ncbi:hypothetical protein JTE90_003295 [Oedothorax gibbosus]|uniref:Uncharacterized protein n=1 Tax=Oedothorax gibbosus TaxID=931172 RepID=A0AAV6V4R4_9ARAC|nr:hypothetical protein JTE90_003295 [Oedothorax gibbosus]
MYSIEVELHTTQSKFPIHKLRGHEVTLTVTGTIINCTALSLTVIVKPRGGGRLFKSRIVCASRNELPRSRRSPLEKPERYEAIFHAVLFKPPSIPLLLRLFLREERNRRKA